MHSKATVYKSESLAAEEDDKSAVSESLQVELDKCQKRFTASWVEELGVPKGCDNLEF